MCKESFEHGLGRVYHAVSPERPKVKAEERLRRGRFVPDGQDIARLRLSLRHPSAVKSIEWAAGLFEGEGSIHVHTATSRKYTYRRVAVALGTTDEDVVRAFHKVIGVGSVNGPYKGTNKPYWQWRACGAGANAALDLLLPYLGARRTAKAAEVRETCRTSSS